jgi:hypothetical protein
VSIAEDRPNGLENGTSPRLTKSQIEASAQRPQVLRVKKKGIPRWLRRLARWVCWRYVWRVSKKGEGKWTKVPVNPKTGANALANKEETWGTFREAYALYWEHKDDDGDTKIDGIGIEFIRKGSPEDPDLAGVDLDDAVCPRTGKVKPWAKRVIKKLNGYTELSPSGTGFKVYILARDIFHGTDKQGTNLPYFDGELELYVGGRFFCVTGHALDGTPATVEERSEAMKEVLGWLVEHQRKDEPEVSREFTRNHSKAKSKAKSPTPAPVPSANGRHGTIRGDINLFLARLKGVTTSGNGQYTAICPGHLDHKPSLSVSLGRNRAILLHCFAKGCPAQAIVNAMGLTMSDLFVPGSRNGKHERPQPEPRKATGKSYPGAKEALAALDALMERKHEGRRVARYRYLDAEGCLTALVVRYNLPTEQGEKTKKTFRPVSKWPDGWHCCDPEQWPLYLLPKLIDATTVYVVEGEKCADFLTNLGITATTSAHGSQSPHKTDWSPLAGKQVILAPDNDDAGDAYITAVTAILSQLSPPPTIMIGKPLSSKE